MPGSPNSYTNISAICGARMFLNLRAIAGHEPGSPDERQLNAIHSQNLRCSGRPGHCRGGRSPDRYRGRPSVVPTRHAGRWRARLGQPGKLDFTWSIRVHDCAHAIACECRRHKWSFGSVVTRRAANALRGSCGMPLRLQAASSRPARQHRRSPWWCRAEPDRLGRGLAYARSTRSLHGPAGRIARR